MKNLTTLTLIIIVWFLIPYTGISLIYKELFDFSFAGSTISYVVYLFSCLVFYEDEDDDEDLMLYLYEDRQNWGI